MKDKPDDDPIAEAVLSENTEQQLRYAGWAFLGRYELPTKLRAVGSVSGFVAIGLFAITAVRGERLRAVMDTAPLSATTTASIVLATGLKFLTFGAVLLVFVGVVRRRDGSDLDAEQLLGIEETASLLGLGTGGLGVLAGMALFVILAVSSPTSPSAFAANLASHVDLPVSYGVLLGWSAVVATVSFAASIVFQ